MIRRKKRQPDFSKMPHANKAMRPGIRHPVRAPDEPPGNHDAEVTQGTAPDLLQNRQPNRIGSLWT
jgi:hypothetical protein